MATQTPNAGIPSHTRSVSQSHQRIQTPPPARPTTPLRPLSRSSLRSSHTPNQGPGADYSDPIASLEPAFAEFSDSMADLEANFMHLQLLHESISRFNECFASFLYGLSVNAFCVDFTEAPVQESFQRAKTDPRFEQPRQVIESTMFNRSGQYNQSNDADQTFLSTDTSFVENPPASAKKPTSIPPSTGLPTRSTSGTQTRGGRGNANAPPGRGAPRGRTSGLARARGRGRGATKG